MFSLLTGLPRTGGTRGERAPLSVCVAGLQRERRCCERRQWQPDDIPSPWTSVEPLLKLIVGPAVGLDDLNGSFPTSMIL